jgi:protein-disulfide isomerase/uncharacterized membrane protein
VEVMKKVLIFILSLLGLLISFKLVQIYFDANFLTGSTGHFCSINSVVDCNGVAQSKYSNFLGIPLALYGLGFYIAIIGLLLLEKLTQKFSFFKHFEDLKNPMAYIHLMAVFSIFVSVTLAYVSNFQIHKICLLCYMTYGINALIFVVASLKQSLFESFKTTVADFKAFIKNPSNKIFIPFVGLLFFIVVLFFNQTQVLVPTAQDVLDRGNVLGDRTSHLRLYVYSDYNCPYCARMNVEVHDLVNNVDGLRVDRIEYPIDKTCNPRVKGRGFHNSCQAARYALAAKEQGKYVMMSSLLFENNDNLSERNILRVARKHGIDTKKLYQDAHSPKIKEELADNIKTATDTGINSTPSTKIGVKIYNYYLSYDELYAIVSEYKDVVR